MMAISGSARALALAVALTAFASSEAGANVVRNNSFEDDGFPGNTLICPISSWNGCAGINAGEAENIDPILVGHGGYLAIGTVGSLGYVRQDIATTVGQKYRFSFEFGSDGDASNRFQALWGGAVLMDVAGTPFNPDWSSGRRTGRRV